MPTMIFNDLLQCNNGLNIIRMYVCVVNLNNSTCLVYIIYFTREADYQKKERKVEKKTHDAIIGYTTAPNIFLDNTSVILHLQCIFFYYIIRD